MAEVTLSDEVKEALRVLGPRELIVGIPSYNHAATISHVLQTAQAGLAKYFPDRKALIVNADGGSEDGTRECVEQSGVGAEALLVVKPALDPVDRLTMPYHGVPGREGAFRTFFHIAELTGAHALAVVDADLRSLTPEWLNSLLQPVVCHGFDCVAPYYTRHKYSGLLTKSIVYPLIRALYGCRVHNPLGGEFGISGRLASRLRNDGAWNTDVARYAVDLWMTTTAMAENYRVCQAAVGPKINDPRPPLDLGTTLVQVVGSVFSLMENYEVAWRNVLGSLPARLLGHPFVEEPEPAPVNLPRALASFQQGVRDLASVYSQVFASRQLRELELRAADPLENFAIDDELWVGLIYDLALAYHGRVIDREHLLKSLAPLYLGWVASFARQTAQETPSQVEHRIERLCLVYEQLKPYLLNKWPLAGREKR